VVLGSTSAGWSMTPLMYMCTPLFNIPTTAHEQRFDQMYSTFALCLTKLLSISPAAMHFPTPNRLWVGLAMGSFVFVK
jgi:hypothetical protein